jgi:hypothetical protein
VTATTATAPGGNSGRPSGARREVLGELQVDLGEPARSGGWNHHPRARYLCYRCRTVEGPVHGAEAVTDFTADIRTAHRARCAAPGAPGAD